MYCRYLRFRTTWTVPCIGSSLPWTCFPFVVSKLPKPINFIISASSSVGSENSSAVTGFLLTNFVDFSFDFDRLLVLDLDFLDLFSLLVDLLLRSLSLSCSLLDLLSFSRSLSLSDPRDFSLSLSRSRSRSNLRSLQLNNINTRNNDLDSYLLFLLIIWSISFTVSNTVSGARSFPIFFSLDSISRPRTLPSARRRWRDTPFSSPHGFLKKIE